MKKVKANLDTRPNTAKENKRVLSELRKCKIDHQSLHEINKYIAKFNTKNALRLSKNTRASLGTEDKIVENLYGPIDGFPIGSWWGIRMDCSRDGVHKPFDKDIQDGPFGAVSLCTSHSNANNDVDLGDYLTVTANNYDPNVQTVHPLLQNHRNQLPLRLIRSYNLSNNYAPKTGYRYDGLYAVVGCWIGVESDARKCYKFALARLLHQDPPVWRLSRKSLSSVLEKSKIQDIRSGKRRSINDRVNNSRNYANDEISMKNVRSRSLIMRHSSQKLNFYNHESDIVTRCISKKSDGRSCSNMISVPYPETLSPGGNRLLDDSPKSPVCKFQNTNISIRTDLYDSSNMTRQEIRKTTPMTFCRTYKNSRLPGRAMNHSNVVSLNLNSCGPCPRDNEQESLIQSRSGIPKFSSCRSSSSDSVVDSFTAENSSIVNAELKTSLNDESNHSPIIDENITEINAERSTEISEKNHLEKEIESEKSVEKMTNVTLETTSDFDNPKDHDDEQTCIPIEKKSSENRETSLFNGSELTEESFSKESHTDINSLTPDQMLNFIVKQKYHPTAKLLIGSVIGLATGESTILRAYESLISRKNCLTHEKTISNEKNEMKSVEENEENVPIVDPCDYDREKNTNNKKRNDERKVSKTLSAKRVLRESKDRLMRKIKLRRTRVSKSLVGTEKKSNAINLGASTSYRLRKSNITDVKSQQAFSKSTILKKSKKCAKKRRGELANLVIDANIGPLIRGPRNRRLRCKTHIFAKRHGNNDIVANCCSEKTRNVVGKGVKKEITRVDLTPRKSKISSLKSQISDSRFANARKTRESERNNIERRRVKLRENDKVGEKKISNDETTKRKRRKLSHTSNYGNEQTSNESRKSMCNDSCKNIHIRKPKMVNASTQYTISRKDATTCVDGDIIQSARSNNHLNSIKIEWIDVDDVKSEINEDSEEADLSINERNEESEDFHEISTDESSSTIGQGLSAFVPVNISDDDSRIARLRSIGFKPINPAEIIRNEKQRSNDHDENFSVTLVKNRNVDELFMKYSSEETTTVGYMDQELHYQDIEDEEKNIVRKKKIICRKAKRGRIIAKMRNDEIEETGIIEGRITSSNEEDSEIPWHGWKKNVKNKQAQWTGW